MQVKVEILEGLERKLIIEIPAQQVADSVTEKLNKLQKTAKIDGFRKGKVPMTVVEKQYKGSVVQDALGSVIDNSYSEAVKSEKLVPAGQPHITPISGFDGTENFVYEAVLEVIPEFDVKGIDSMTISQPVVEIEQQDVDKMIETLRKQAATWEKSDDASKEGDKVVVDFAGEIEGEEFAGGSAEDVNFVLGAKQMLPEFEDAIIGKNVGDKTSATVNFPENYHGKEVAGKTAVFAINVRAIDKPKLPEVNDEFIKRFGVGDGSRTAFESAIKENMQRELDASIRKAVHQQVMQQLVDANHVAVPEIMVAQEKNRMVEESGVTKQIKDAAEIEKIKNETFDQPARRRVLLGLIMSKLFDEKQIKPDVSRVDKYVADIAKTYEKPEEVLAYYQQTPQALEQVYAQIMEDQLIESILEGAKIVEEKKTFDDLMTKQPA